MLVTYIQLDTLSAAFGQHRLGLITNLKWRLNLEAI